MLRILLVDDHAVVRAGYRRLLEQADVDWVVEEAATGEGAYRLSHETAFDVVVMDLSLPGMSGIETLRRMRKRDARIRNQQGLIKYQFHPETIATRAGSVRTIKRKMPGGQHPKPNPASRTIQILGVSFFIPRIRVRR